MPYAILTVDKPDHLHLRTSAREEHLAYLTANKHKLLAAGALIDDDGTGGRGGLGFSASSLIHYFVKLSRNSAGKSSTDPSRLSWSART